MRHESPSRDELIALVRDNPGFVLIDHVNSLDWGDLSKFDNFHARDVYRCGVSKLLMRLVRQGYLRRDSDQKPPRFFVRETIEPVGMKKPRYKHYVEFDGERVPLIELSKRYGVKRKTLYSRIIVRGWPIEEALTKPPDGRRRSRSED